MATRDICKSREGREIRKMSEYENRRYNKNETSKQFYLRRKKDMEDYFANPYYKIYEKKMWDEYKKANIK